MNNLPPRVGLPLMARRPRTPASPAGNKRPTILPTPGKAERESRLETRTGLRAGEVWA